MFPQKCSCFAAFIICLPLLPYCFGAIATEQTADATGWSAAINGLEARIALVEKPREFGTRWIVPYLELRNVRDLAHPLEVRCDRTHVQFELVDSAGNKLTGDKHMSLDRSGPVPDLDRVILPCDSSIRISMECRNWGVPKAAAMISTDSGAWIIQEAEKGKCFLRATIIGEKIPDDRYKTWQGKLETPLVKVDWK